MREGRIGEECSGDSPLSFATKGGLNGKFLRRGGGMGDSGCGQITDVRYLVPQLRL